MEGWMILSGLCVSALVGHLLGKSKGKPVAGALIGFFLGPLGWLLVSLSPDARPKCPHCKGAIVAGAKKCQNCGSEIPRCPACGKQVGLKHAVACRHCGADLDG